MVHALQIVHRLLEDGGHLIDIHPSGEPPPIEVVPGGRRALAGYVQESDDFVTYAQAEAALAQAVRLGLFRLERQGVFEFVTHAATLAELLAYLEETWSDAIVAPEVQRRAAELLGGDRGRSLALTERVRIARLRAGSAGIAVA